MLKSLRYRKSTFEFPPLRKEEGCKRKNVASFLFKRKEFRMD